MKNAILVKKYFMSYYSGYNRYATEYILPLQMIA